MNFIKKIFGQKKIQTQVFDISLPKMQSAFDQMEKEAGWDVKMELYWGYYFLEHEVSKLESFAKQLEKLGFRIVEIRIASEDKEYLMHAEEHITHSPKSLFEKCHELAKLANKNEIEVFDGWDVEQMTMNKGLVE